MGECLFLCRGGTRNGAVSNASLGRCARLALDLRCVPTISAFYGILIRMFFNEHAPPHFHVQYAECTAEIEIETLRTIRGTLPRRALALVLEWAAIHREQLLTNWEHCRKHEQPLQIEPLE